MCFTVALSLLSYTHTCIHSYTYVVCRTAYVHVAANVRCTFVLRLSLLFFPLVTWWRLVVCNFYCYFVRRTVCFFLRCRCCWCWCAKGEWKLPVRDSIRFSFLLWFFFSIWFSLLCSLHRLHSFHSIAAAAIFRLRWTHNWEQTHTHTHTHTFEWQTKINRVCSLVACFAVSSPAHSLSLWQAKLSLMPHTNIQFHFTFRSMNIVIAEFRHCCCCCC